MYSPRLYGISGNRVKPNVTYLVISDCTTFALEARDRSSSVRRVEDGITVGIQC
jgi:hypothetical protein